MQLPTTSSSSSSSHSSSSGGGPTNHNNNNNMLQHMAYECPGLGKESRLDVRPTKMGAFLEVQQVVIPLFQRRYCWREAQFGRWVRDLAKGGSHGLGKSVFKWMHGEFVCIDGQQRVTTTLLFLAAVSDALRELDETSMSESDLGLKRGLAQLVTSMLYVNPSDFHEWMERAKSEGADDLLARGETLPFSRLIPSYLDRRPYYVALVGKQLGMSMADGSSESESHQLLAKRYFDEYLGGRSLSSLSSLTETLLFKFFMMRVEVLTPINMSQVFLWLQEKSLVGMGALLHNPSPGIAFRVCDLVRNLVMADVMDEPRQVQEQFYRHEWLVPLEEKFGDGFGSVMDDFIDTLPSVSGEESKVIQVAQMAKKSGVLGERGVRALQAYGKMSHYIDVRGVPNVLQDIHRFASSRE